MLRYESLNSVMIPFTKLAGSGNDFILIDNRRAVIPASKLKRLAVQLCRRGLSVGADGLIVVEPSSRADFKWVFFNSDGSRAGFCGNGARCVARFAHIKKIAPKKMIFETRVGLIAAQVMSVRDERVKVRMPNPKNIRLNLQLLINRKTHVVHSIDTGVPHCVYFVKDINAVDVQGLGKAMRHHKLFSPLGTNVNFVTVLNEGRIGIRTYERGVEGETLACGTGSVAAAVIAGQLLSFASPVTVIPSSGISLVVSFGFNTKRDHQSIFLEGDARVIYDGHIKPGALN